MKARIERAVRRRVPSISLLTYHPVVRLALDTVDLPSRLLIPEYRSLPPNHLRCRVGVGNRLIGNQPAFLSTWKFWFWTYVKGWVDLDSTVVDIGCGCGRYAHSLRSFRIGSTHYSGDYVGVDIDSEALAWCRANYDPMQYTFLQSPHESSSYRGGDADAKGTRAIPPETADFVFSTSLFSHLLERELAEYLAESSRMLRSGGYCVHSYFSIDRLPPTYNGRHTFRHRLENSYVESRRQPTAAVAYHDDFVVQLADDRGLELVAIESGPGSWQPMLVLSKRG